MQKVVAEQQHLDVDTALHLLLDMLRINTSTPPGNELPLARLIAEAMNALTRLREQPRATEPKAQLC